MNSKTFEPRQFGRYHLVERLATGGMAEIFKAKVRGAHGFEKTVVIKRILPHLAEDVEFIDMFIDEAKLTAQLTHPKVVQVLDFGEVDGHYFMALEYVDGIDLLAMLRQCARRRCRPTTGIALHIAAEVLDALDYAHNATEANGQPLGVIHRDISPSNVFISWQGEVKLGDFGIARAAIRRGHTEGGALKGKYGYMAPEQVTDAPVDQRADLFAVGVVVAELLMIRRLFYAKNDLEVLLQVRDARLTRLDKYGRRIPADLRVIIESALARDPNMRYQKAGVFRDALHRYLFENRRMVRSSDVRNFLLRLTESDDPLLSAPVDSLEIRAAQVGAVRRAKPRERGVTPPRGAEITPARRTGTEYSEVDLNQRVRVSKRKSSPELERELERDEQTAPLPTQPERFPARELSPVARELELLVDSGRFKPPHAVGRKRRIVLTPPPIPLPVPTGLPHTGEQPRLATSDALAAVPEMAADSSSAQSDFNLQRNEPAIPQGPFEVPDGEVIATRLPQLSEQSIEVPPARQGGLADQSLFAVLFQLAVEEETGMLVLSSGDSIKEIFLVNGDPHYVTSNRAEELFGQYLVQHDVLSKGELSMALAMLPHFNGKLGDTLVALKLLRPVEVLRHLTHQVRQKLLETFAWRSGEYRYYPGKLCEQESAPLGLDAFEIIGAAVETLSEETLQQRLQPLMRRRLRAVSPAPVPPEVFRRGGLPRRVYDRLNGRQTLSELLVPYDDPEHRQSFLRVVYLLVEVGLAD